jgi:hypothetical protein
MPFVLTISLPALEDPIDNDNTSEYAFELYEILDKLAYQILEGGVDDAPERVFDTHGKSVGSVRYF